MKKSILISIFILTSCISKSRSNAIKIKEDIPFISKIGYNVYFDEGSNKILKESYSTIDNWVKLIKSDDNWENSLDLRMSAISCNQEVYNDSLINFKRYISISNYLINKHNITSVYVGLNTKGQNCIIQNIKRPFVNLKIIAKWGCVSKEGMD